MAVTPELRGSIRPSTLNLKPQNHQPQAEEVVSSSFNQMVPGTWCLALAKDPGWPRLRSSSSSSSGSSSSSRGGGGGGSRTTPTTTTTSSTSSTSTTSTPSTASTRSASTVAYATAKTRRSTSTMRHGIFRFQPEEKLPLSRALARVPKVLVPRFSGGGMQGSGFGRSHLDGAAASVS